RVVAAGERHPLSYWGYGCRVPGAGSGGPGPPGCVELSDACTGGHDVTDVVTEPSAPILRLRGVGRRFGGLHAVRDVDLDVAPGERRAILGPNGAGKTTLFNLISGDIPQTSGTIEFEGLDIGEVPPAGRTHLGIGRTYQKSRLFLGLSVEDNLYLAVLGSRQ